MSENTEERAIDYFRERHQEKPGARIETNIDSVMQAIVEVYEECAVIVEHGCPSKYSAALAAEMRIRAAEDPTQ